MSADAAPPMVELRGVTKRFGSAVAVDQISLQIRPAEFLTLLGPSGCGKTTLLRLIAGFETPSAHERPFRRGERVYCSLHPHDLVALVESAPVRRSLPPLDCHCF